MIMSLKSYVLFFGFLLIFQVLADDCKAWFENLKISSENCLMECALAETDMRTFYCSERCAVLCDSSIKEKFLFNLSYIYLRLTNEERVLLTQHPKKMLEAYGLSVSAESQCLDLFKISKVNDVSDTCRHFIWSALLYQKFGYQFSKQVLDAHENNPRQSSKEKEMDLKNNELGLKTVRIF